MARTRKRIGERISGIADRHLAFLHRFQQRALHFGRRAIDFIGQNQVRKKRAELGRELAGARIVYKGADQIRRQQVGRKLQTLEAGLDAGGHGFDGERLGQTGDAFEQDVAVREQTEQEPIDQIFLTDHDVTDLFAQRRNPFSHFLHLLRDFLRRFHKKNETGTGGIRSIKFYIFSLRARQLNRTGNPEYGSMPRMRPSR